MTRILSTSVFSLVIAASSVAQDSDQVLTPEHGKNSDWSSILVQIDSPARMQKTLGCTRLGSLLKERGIYAGIEKLLSPNLRPDLGTLRSGLLRKQVADFLQWYWKFIRRPDLAAGPHARSQWEALQFGLGDVSARITIGMRWRTPVSAEPPDIYEGILIIEPDEEVDLDALSASIAKRLPESGAGDGAWPGRYLGTWAPQVAETGDLKFGRWWLPIPRDGRLVGFFTARQDKDRPSEGLPLYLESWEKDLTLDHKFRNSPIAVMADNVPYPQLPGSDNQELIRGTTGAALASGLKSIRDLRITVQPRGRYIQIDSQLRFAPEGPSGIYENMVVTEPRATDAVLARIASLNDTVNGNGAHREIDSVLDLAPRGVQNITFFDVAGGLRNHLWQLLPSSDAWEEQRQFLEDLEPSLSELGLTQAVGFTAWDDNTWTYRVIW